MKNILSLKEMPPHICSVTYMANDGIVRESVRAFRPAPRKGSKTIAILIPMRVRRAANVAPGFAFDVIFNPEAPDQIVYVRTPARDKALVVGPVAQPVAVESGKVENGVEKNGATKSV